MADMVYFTQKGEEYMNIPYKKDFLSIKEYKKARDVAICQMYQDNELITHIARDLQINKQTVHNVLQKHNLYDPSKSKVHLNKERLQRNELIFKLYTEGLSSLEIARKLNIGKSNVREVLIKFYGVHTYGTNAETKWRKHNIDKHFFQTIDTQLKAYWLGFLYADGCITDKSIRLDLAAIDYDHLEKFKEALNANSYPLYHRQGIDSYVCVINSKDMVTDLSHLGCVSRKTHVLQFPSKQMVPDYLIHHFMRGYFDGDGSICVGKGTESFSVVGTEQFIQNYQIQLNYYIHKDHMVKHSKTVSDGIVTLRLGGRQQIIRIYNFLYNDATIFLDRKRNKFMQIVKD